ncbi:MAG: ribosome-associated ATPase/putative transporter RbbA [Bosea sp.]|uniref:ribosome-associated ATPase/putative transporter RbbA n=1 Tax=Bosea sp. (in: a-proteobacteria) TaxID=1871050 RepID=UPI002381EB84|nr:ribosome-associated ATPase/putative transporter RbbA [Bosea sp. (in: a-proteobacteria)]MCP4736136.1 ribosome-associated ATPase/putative transporter RbbA [Bosea sp. (in: a-proteobacteria)]
MEVDPAAVSLSGIQHAYGKVVALRDLALTIPAGCKLAIVGPDGVGKSTLLGLIAGVRRIQRGSVNVLGGDMASAAHRSEAAPRIAYMPQGLGRNLYPTLSVYENIDFFARLYSQPDERLRGRISELMRVTGLFAFADRPAGKLSGGMKQKLGLCCALVHDPDLLILDEPTTGIDPLSRRQFWTLIARIQAERPTMTVIVATAYMEEAGAFDRIVAIDDGAIIADGSQAELLARTGAATLEQAYIELQRPERRGARVAATAPRLEADGRPPAIVAEGLTMRFGDFTAVDHVSFRIDRGEIFGFLGSNGCGKTTTMKMLTGLLPATEGRAELLGKPVDARDISTRTRIGYVSQSFSLYEELTVRGNLELHGRLCGIGGKGLGERVEEALSRFELGDVAATLPDALPLGMRQRLQLAAACLHRPDVLILDEPTSGVDPAARDRFWNLLLEMSRRDGVTIFISTHFMNEAERCDRVSLMHAGRVLAVGAPRELQAARGAASLEDAFVAYLEDAAAAGAEETAVEDARSAVEPGSAMRNDDAMAVQRPRLASMKRIWTFARREALELSRDRIRLAFALIGPLLLMAAFGYGISFDIEGLRYAVLDRDQSLESRAFLDQFSNSRYFVEQARLKEDVEIDRRLRAGELKFAVDIPPGFGRDLLQGHRPEVGFWLDGGNTFPAETARAYILGTLQTYAGELARAARSANGLPAETLRVEPRFRYNQDFRSVFAITPGSIMLLLIIFPAMLTALGVVREKEMGSIANVYASPATVGEYLLGKQLPYVVIGVLSYLSLLVFAGGVLGVVPKGSLLALSLAALVYVFAATAFGLLVSAFVSTQVAAIFGTAILTAMTAAHYSGFLIPASSLEGPGRIMGLSFPALWFQTISLGVFAKGLDTPAFARELLVLVAFALGFLLLARLMIRKQGA